MACERPTRSARTGQYVLGDEPQSPRAARTDLGRANQSPVAAAATADRRQTALRARRAPVRVRARVSPPYRCGSALGRTAPGRPAAGRPAASVDLPSAAQDEVADDEPGEARVRPRGRARRRCRPSDHHCAVCRASVGRLDGRPRTRPRSALVRGLRPLRADGSAPRAPEARPAPRAPVRVDAARVAGRRAAGPVRSRRQSPGGRRTPAEPSGASRIVVAVHSTEASSTARSSGQEAGAGRGRRCRRRASEWRRVAEDDLQGRPDRSRGGRRRWRHPPRPVGGHRGAGGVSVGVARTRDALAASRSRWSRPARSGRGRPRAGSSGRSCPPDRSGA